MSIKDTLMSIHHEIRDQRTLVLQISERMESIREHLKSWEMLQTANIANATDESGKPLYSNEAKRKAELDQRKKDSDEYFRMNCELKSLKSSYDHAVIALQWLIDRQEHKDFSISIGGVTYETRTSISDQDPQRLEGGREGAKHPWRVEFLPGTIQRKTCIPYLRRMEPAINTSPSARGRRRQVDLPIRPRDAKDVSH